MYTLLRFESLSAVCGVHQFESGSAGSGTFQHNLRWRLRRLFARTVYCIRDPRRATVVTVRTFWNRLRFSVRSVLRTRLTVQLYSVYSESSAQQSQYHTSSIKIFCCQSDVTTHLALGSGQNSPLHTQPCYNVQIQIMGSRVSGRWRRSAFRLSEKAMPF